MGSEQQVDALSGVNLAHPAQRVRGDHGAVGLGKIDADESDRLPGFADERRLLAATGNW